MAESDNTAGDATVPARHKGAGGTSSKPRSVRPVAVAHNPVNRFVHQHGGPVSEFDQPLPVQSVTLTAETCRSVIQTNQSPDVPFEYSINPYRGCEHGCVYCFARPTHSYLDLSPGMDFETRLFYKHNLLEVLRKEMASRRYVCKPVVVGAATDPYQPVEKEVQLTRQLLLFLERCRHPVSLITKSSLILRDIDVLARLAQHNLVSVAVSVTTLDNTLKSRLEPRASAGSRRLEVIRQLHQAGVPVVLLVAPVIPFINDHEMETIVQEGVAAGACAANYIVLRLPHELKGIWRDWLHQHYPMRAGKVMQVLRAMRGGQDYQSNWFERKTGTGHWADLLQGRFRLALKKAGIPADYLEQNQSAPAGYQPEAYARAAARGEIQRETQRDTQQETPGPRRKAVLDTTQFVPPPRNEDQLTLF